MIFWKNFLRGNLFLFILLLLAGCISHKPFSVDDKLKSMASCDEMELAITSTIANNTGQYREFTASVHGYQMLHSAMLVAADDFDEESLHISDSISNSTVDGEDSISIEFEITWSELKNVSSGHAVLISEDGYFATAAHVINREDNRLIFYLANNEVSDFKAMILPIRKVLVDEAADFAIIKADVVSPIHMILRDSPIDIGDGIYCGGWMNGGASYGVMKQMEEHHSEQLGRFFIFRTTAPVMFGDSGSAGIDEMGRLFGVAASLETGFVKRSTFVMPEISRIRQIIEDDRKLFPQSQNEEAVP